MRDDYHDSAAKLVHHPRIMLLLWREYLYGLAGNKLAKNFTSVERGKVKFNSAGGKSSETSW
jgi:hypothetical protein